jgi:transcriptional regulator with XRE-family HTH domain
MPGRPGRGARALAGVGLTQQEVADAAGLSQWTVSQVLRGVGSREARKAVIAAIAGLAGIASAATVEGAVILHEQDETDR